MKNRLEVKTSHGSYILLDVEKIDYMEEGPENVAIVYISGKTVVLEKKYTDMKELLHLIFDEEDN